jgi:tRNA nucleotidyltransferase (CCA-adding enzyme)
LKVSGVTRIDLKKMPDDVYRRLLDAGHLADAWGKPVFCVGGVIRDAILGSSSRDIDIVVEGDGIAFAVELGRCWRARVATHEKFGTAVIRCPDGSAVDVVTARRETYARPGALPDVVPGLITDDLFRRDFTINAVAAALNKAEFGFVYDDFGGCADIKAGLIRVMHYRSFIDDPTRIMRALRYEKRFDFKLEARTSSILKEAINENAFRAITPPRYFGEFKRILQEENPCPVLRRLAALDGCRYFVYNAEIESGLKGVLRSGLEGVDRWIGLLSVLIAPLDIESAEELLVKFNMTRVEKKKVLKRFL